MKYANISRWNAAINRLYDSEWAGILSDMQIDHLSRTEDMISPYVGSQVKHDEDGSPVISYGLSSYGYDIRLADEFKLFNKTQDGRVIDPKNFNGDDFVTHYSNKYNIIVPPGALLLGRSVERFNIPRNCTAVCLGKSTLARCGVIVNVTPLEAEWSGELVIEITNGTSFPVMIYANEGVAQLIFHWNGSGCHTSYKDRKGKYQNQSGIISSRV